MLDQTNAGAGFLLTDERKVFSQYAGSLSCRECHREAFDQWAQSNHALAEHPLQTSRDLGAFEPARSFRHGTQTSHVRWAPPGAQVTALGRNGKVETMTVERVIGNEPLRQFLVAFDRGRWQVLETAFDPQTNQWFNVFGDEDRQPGEWGHWTGRGMNWNNMCAGCHNTRLRKNYDEAGDAYHTTMAEVAVGCEACHGPLKAHVEWQGRYRDSARRDPTLPKLTRQQGLDVCGSCHARRSELTGDFRVGDPFLDHMELVLVDATDRYYPDGQVRDEDYEYGSFLGSRMHLRGVSCQDCHQPHSGKTILPGNWLCMRCHSGVYPNAIVIQPVEHSHHHVHGYRDDGTLAEFDLMNYRPKQIQETGGECVNCHMPQTAYMQRHWRHDHGLTIPDPALTKDWEVPNACNRCHKDQTLDWAAAWVKQWYGAKMDRVTRRRAVWIAEARQGDVRGREGLLGLLGTEEIAFWRASAVELLAPWVGEGEVTAAVLRELRSTNALSRAAAVRVLAPIADRSEVRTALESRLSDNSRNVRVAAAWSLHQVLDQSTRAASELKHFLAINADQPNGQFQQGILEYAHGRSLMALAHLEKAVAWDPNAAAIRQELAVVLSDLNRGAEALGQLREACRLAPRDAEAHYRLGLACHEAGDLAGTLKELAAAWRLDPIHARAAYNLGLAQNEAGQPEQAVETLRRAQELAPRDARIPYARATVLMTLGRAEEARRALEGALAIEPTYDDARRLLESLTRR